MSGSKLSGLSLKWKIFLLFGVPGVLAILAASCFVYQYAHGVFSRNIETGLMSVATIIAKTIDRERVETLTSEDDPFYDELKGLLENYSDSFNLSWVALAKYNGLYFTHIADAEGYYGIGYCFGHPIMDIPDEMMSAWQGEPAFVDAYEDAYGFWVSAFFPIFNANGEVIAVLDVSRDIDEINRLNEAIFTRTVWLLIIFLLIILVLCFAAAAKATGPLTELSLAAEKIAGGQLDTNIKDLKSGHEVNLVVESFNTMAAALRKSQASLERKIYDLSTLFDVANKINSATNITDISKIVLEKAIDSLAATRGSIMRFVEEEDALELDIAIGHGDGPFEAQIRLRSGEGVAGKAFATLETIVVTSLPAPDFKPYPAGIEQNIDNIICVPLVNEGKAVGVMSLVNRPDEEVDEDDLHLVNTICSHLALAMEKSRVYELAITDGLTKLFDHRYFQHALEKELKRAARFKTNVSMVLFDVDHFKSFNDTYGHQIGDVVLRHIAQIVKDALRTIDIVARYGGEEFTIVMPETDESSAKVVAERVRAAVEAYDFPGAEKPLNVTISLGVASYPTDAIERMDLIQKADQALYKSKENGRNRVTLFSDVIKDQQPES